MRRGWFISATGTGAGKTLVTRGLAAALRRRGLTVAALKPLETGCAPDPADALALGQACGRPDLAHAPGFYRAEPALSPRAIAVEGGPEPPAVASLAQSVERAAEGAAVALVEGAGGLFVPLRAEEDVLDLARAIGLPIALVAPDRLGVLSDVRAATAAARARGGHVAFVILSRHPRDATDPSRRSNAAILRETGVPVCIFDQTEDTDDALANAAERSGALDYLYD